MIKRYEKNPILSPDFKSSWEAYAVFNPCPVIFKGKIYLLYRALSLPHYHHLARMVLSVSDIGICESKDGINFKKRRKFIWPEYEWEKFGCEDPRIVEFEGNFYIFYTALSVYPFSSEGIKVGLAISKDLKSIKEKHLISPFNAKAMSLFPERIDGKIWAILTVNTDRPPVEICLWQGERIEDLWNEKKWIEWYKEHKNWALNLKRNDKDYIEVGSPPIKTPYGWLLFFSYIKDYFSPSRIFTVEAMLLDLKDPRKIISRTKFPLLFPLQHYERIGIVNNVVFPSGAILKGKKIYLYYGAADTVCALAFVDFEELIKKLTEKKEFQVIKLEKPIISPTELPWESKATFNPGVIYLEGKFHILYRAMSQDNTSVFGYAQSDDGLHITYRSKEPVYIPREDFEKKIIPKGNSGCEDPRITYIKEDKKIYLLYTAFDGLNPPKVAFSSIKVDDFLSKNWNWEKPKVISFPNLDDKDACLFPEKINGKYWIVHRVGDDIDITCVDNLEFKDYLGEIRWIWPRPGFWDSRKVGAGAPPIKTSYGWLLIYHGVDEKGVYRVGFVLADLKNPLKIISRSYEPFMEPDKDWEIKGLVDNVVFPCGMVMLKDKIFIYYGGADKVVGVALTSLKDVLTHLGIK